MYYPFVKWHDGDTIICIRTKQKCKYRKDPIPATGRNGGYCWLRCPRSMPEKVKYIACYADLQQELRKEYACPIKLTRAKRSFALLPDPYDDIPRSNCMSKSWKNDKKRRKQWWRIRK